MRETPDSGTEEIEAQILLLSARDNMRLEEYASSLLMFLEKKQAGQEALSLVDVAYTLQVGRDALNERFACVTNSMATFRSLLQRVAQGESVAEAAYRGNAKRDKEKLQALAGPHELAERVTTMRMAGQYHQLAELWASGASIDWASLFYGPGAGIQPFRVALPTYPFARTRYWPAFPGRGEQQKGWSHPLLSSTSEAGQFVIKLTGNEFCLTDHIVQGHSILPGAAYIEIARAAGERFINAALPRISGLVWLSPVVFTGAPLELRLTFQQDERSLEFEITSEGTKTLKHCIGRLSQDEPPDGAAPGMGSVPLEEIKQRCSLLKTREDCYGVLRTQGLNYGDGFQVLEQFSCSRAEALSLVQLPEKVRDHRLRLHPSLIDGALQTALLFDRENAGNDQLAIPYSVAEITMSGSLPERCYVYVKPSATHSQMSKGRECDLLITDTTGRIIVSLRGVSARPIERKQIPDTEPAIHYYQPQWVHAEQHAEEASPISTDRKILTIDASHLAHDLRDKGFSVTMTTLSALFERSEESGRETFAPGALLQPESLPDYIVLHFPDTTHFLYEDLIQQDFARFFAFCKALCSHSLRKRVKLLCTCINKEDMLSRSVVHRALAGFLVSMRQENPKIDVAVLEMQIADGSVQWGRSMSELVLDVLRGVESCVEMRAVFRHGSWEKYIRRIKPIQLARPPVHALPLKEKGVYLITGGMGKIGLIFAAYLVKRTHARLVLTGRTALTDAMRAKLLELEHMGAEVIYRQADVSRRSDVQALLRDARTYFGQIDGVIHCAGVLRDSLLLRKTWEQVDSVLAPKVLGTAYIDEETRDDHLDFVVLCSSLVAMLGNVGQCDYAYANRFMDEYAQAHNEARNERAHSTRYVSINWPLWRDGGMSVTAEERLRETIGMVPMSTRQGLETFELILQADLSQVIAVAGFAERIDRVLLHSQPGMTQPSSLAQPQKVPVDLTRNPIAGPRPKEEGTALKTWVLKHIKEVVASETSMAVAGIDAQEPLEAYGIDSLLVVSITRRLEETFGELSKTLLFEYQTISTLAEYFVENHREVITTLIAPVPSEPQTPPARDDAPALVSSPDDSAVFRIGEQPMQKEVIPGSESQDDIAIIGIAGQFPMAENVEEFWKNLKEGRDCITEIPPERWDHRAFPDVMKWGGFMEGVDKFDPLFFNISNREAEWLDPQERLFLQVVYHTLEDAGYNKKTLADAHVGVYVGLMWGQYQLYGAEKANAASSYGSIANRVSYFFNFRGPSIALDTMCSSSLAAIHLACMSLKSGETDVAVAGGVNVNVHPNKHLFLSTRGFAASDGRCRSFGEGGDGYVPGEGIAAVLLKPLEKARRDGDRVYAVIRATAINHGGKTNGYTVPNPLEQGRLIAKALEKSRFDPRTISYVEAHGTGTALGDPIELTGLTNAFKPYTTDTQFCSIGSVKSNIGHLEGAAGVASVIKVALQMQHRQLVPSIHSRTLNPHIDFTRTPFYVQQELADWNRPTDEKAGAFKQYPRRAGISSFGAGGANAHLILEEYSSPVPAQAAPVEEAYLITLSAKNKERLQEYAHSLLTFLEERSQVRDAVRGKEKEGRGENIRQDIQTRLHHCIAEVLGVNPQFIDAEDLFEDYGLSSAQLQRLATKISEELRTHLSVEDLESHGSILELSRYLLQTMSELSGAGDETVSVESSLTLANLAYTLQTGREAMEEGVAVIASSLSEFVRLLRQVVAGQYQGEEVYERSLRSSREVEVADGESQEFLEGLMRKRRLQKLAKLWCKGVDIDWSKMYSAPGHTRISLPLYPFAKERCWVTEPTLVSQQVPAVHPPVQHEAAPTEPPRTTSAPAWQESVLQRIFYAPRWVEAPASRMKSLSDRTRKKTLIIYPEDLRVLKQSLVSALMGDQIFEIVLGKTTRLLAQNCWEIDPQDSEAIALCLSYIEKPDVIYFLGGISTEEPKMESHEWYKRSQERGLRSLLSLAKALHIQKTSTHTIQLKIVTNNVYQVLPGEKTLPSAASLIGLAKAVSKEYPVVKTSLIDLDLPVEAMKDARQTFSREQLALLIEENSLQEIAVRKNVIYKRSLVPMDVPPSDIVPFQQNGCYVIIGGTGNVGLKVSRYLAETARARLIWFGRKAVNQEIREKMDLIRNAGGEVQYFSVDITHQDDLLKAMKVVESRWGGIQGVFHSAMDFQFARLHDLDDAGLQTAMGAKVAGTLALQQVLRKVAVNFAVLFSSGEAFTSGNAGWGAYGAACSLQDALGLYMSEHEAYRVHIVNWGYWEDNERGDVAVLKAKGINPLNAANGMEALRRIMVHAIPQAVVLDVEDRILELMGVDLNQHRPLAGSDRAPTAQAVGERSPSSPSVALSSVTTSLPEPARPLVQTSGAKGQSVEVMDRTEVAHRSEPESPAEIAGRVNDYLIGIMSEALRIEKGKIDPETDLGYYGVDSLLVISLHKELEEKLGKLPATLLMEYPSIQALGRFLLEKHRDIVEQNILQTASGPARGKGSEGVLDRPVVKEEAVKQIASNGLAGGPTGLNGTVLIKNNPNVRIIRVVEHSLIPQFLENYGNEYRKGTLAKGEAGRDEQAQISQINDELVQLMVKTSWGKEIEVIVAGSGTPVLFMPAVALTAPVWYQQFKALTPHYQAIVIHAPGFGLSEIISEINTRAVGNLFVEVLAQLKIGRPIHLVASCFGSIAAQYIAKEYPEAIASMTLCGGFFENIGLPDVDPAALSIEDVLALTSTASASLKNDFDNLINRLGGKDPEAEAHFQWCSNLLLNSQCANPLIGIRYLNELLTLSTLDWLPSIAAPTLCIAGVEDTVVNPQASRTISSKVPFARLLEISGAGHYPFLTHPELFNAQLVEHVQEQEMRFSRQHETLKIS